MDLFLTVAEEKIPSKTGKRKRNSKTLQCSLLLAKVEQVQKLSDWCSKFCILLLCCKLHFVFVVVVVVVVVVIVVLLCFVGKLVATC